MKKTFITLASVTALTTLSNTTAFASDIKVKDGETLETIAQEYGTSISELKSLNNITGDVTVGQNLKVLEDNIYTIQEGDTLNTIAEKFDVSVTELKEWNNLTSDLIIVGEKLSVAQEGSEATAQPTSLTIHAPEASSQEETVLRNVSEQTSNENVFNSEDAHAYEVPTFNSNNSTQTAQQTQPVSYSRPSSGGGNNLYTSGQCTYYAFSKRPDIGNTWGNANNWANAAAQSGYTVNNNPSAGAILQSTAGGYGHVAYVDKVNSDGSIQVSEMNYQGVGIVSSRTISASAAGAYNYIH
ncbi:LysM peptidoglycan-binding domain-containing protein [Mammaliicoccus fleurettii]|uniref:LysM peptidoglycan-binding domain-containing protein n=1 Tax=Mammaliicoccus fleurettii TaxID=150056 RepID=A0ABS5MLS0_9STAP|nr:CHAP domain-containing protein [Mammaliicoccus fleurettii]MBL0846964.1 LysM peptidoglycan-binding domain-containing protein [Mammaliicoccus fleurettii]MBS3671688.1 LysM peptidoglycan-binding domain-containing protein [Mammaliicoccus fleurettii]MBS3696814.1 LysM peptidoglycan-binding domain-containing protein [Mammaliicoccus fleurettii]